MPKEYTREQFLKLYKNLPFELQEALSSEETSNNIYDICKKYNLDEEIEEFVEYVGQVLIGVLPPEEFQGALEKELKLKKDVAKKVFQEIHRFVFFPVKENLAALYGKEIIPTAKPAVPPSAAAPPGMKPEEEKPAPPAPEEKSDVYRESVE